MTTSAAAAPSVGLTWQPLARPVASPVFVLYCYFLIDFFLRLSQRIPGYGSLRPTLVLVGLLTILALAQGERLKALAQQPPVRAVLLLVAYIIVSLPLVEWPGSVIRENIQGFVKAVVFIFFTALFVDTDRRLKITVFLFMGLQAVRVLEPLYLYFATGRLGGYTYAGGEFAGRLNGAPADVVNANGLGFVIVTTLGFMHFLLMASPSRLVRLVYLLGLLPTFLYALVLTSSRGAFITAVVLLGFIFWQSRYKALLAVIAVAIAVGGWFQMSDFNRDRYLSLVGMGTQEESVEGRFDLMMKEFELGFYRPIVGHGVGTTAEAKVNQLGGTGQASHNLYGQLLIETGLIGFAIFMTFIWRNYRLLQYNLRRFRELLQEGGEVSSFQIRLNMALLAVFWIYAVYSLNYFGLSQEYWYLFGGLCVAFARSVSRSERALDDGETTRPLSA